MQVHDGESTGGRHRQLAAIEGAGILLVGGEQVVGGTHGHCSGGADMKKAPTLEWSGPRGAREDGYAVFAGGVCDGPGHPESE
jgi:hypothetical protein